MNMTAYDNFITAWNNIDEQDISYLQTKISWNIEDLLKDGPNTDASLLYDATISLGLGACNNDNNIFNNSYFTGEEHYANTITKSFMGATGNVTFDETGSRDPMSASFMFTNMQYNDDANSTIFKAVPSELFTSGRWITLSPYQYSDNTTTAPSELPNITIDYNHINTVLRVLGLIFCITLILLSIAFATWTYKYRNGKIVKASQPFFLYTIGFGTMLMGLSIIPLSIDDKIASQTVCNISCMATPWLLSCGFCIAFSGLFTKVWKLNKLFFNSAMVRVNIKNKEVMIPMIITMLLNVIVMTTWSIGYPMMWVRSVVGVDAFGRTISSLGNCRSPNALKFKITIVVINGSVLLLTLYQAYKARQRRARRSPPMPRCSSQ